MKPIMKSINNGTCVSEVLKGHIVDKYKHYYGANIFPNPDKFIYIEDNCEFCSCLGLTFASDRKLFSEQYLDEPVQNYINDYINEHRDIRSRVVEIGSLISIKKGFGSKLYAMIPFIANEYNADYVLITLTSKGQDILYRFGFEMQYLVDSDKRLVSSGSKWGTFYDYSPKTYILNVGKNLLGKNIKQYANKLGLEIKDRLI